MSNSSDTVVTAAAAVESSNSSGGSVAVLDMSALVEGSAGDQTELVRRWIEARVTLRVALRDGRTLLGRFVCFDHRQNIILADCYELHPVAASTAPTITTCASTAAAPVAATAASTAVSPQPPKAAKKGAAQQKQQRGKAQKKANSKGAAASTETAAQLNPLEDETQQLEWSNRQTEETKYNRYMVRYDPHARQEIRYQGLVLISSAQYTHVALNQLDCNRPHAPPCPLPPTHTPTAATAL